ncbi:MAG: fluoride efflux transporter CrcB [Bryobacterales bacterium]|nr:fluoride efflux transporter CrcB [Bryobacterales bacterium]
MTKYFVVLAGSGLGGLLRYAAGNYVLARLDWRYPAGTFLINIVGSFFIGLAMSLLTERWEVHPYWRLFLVVGLLGGFTTFSTFEFETLQAARNGHRAIAVLYVMSSVGFGYLAVWLGVVLGARR